MEYKYAGHEIGRELCQALGLEGVTEINIRIAPDEVVIATVEYACFPEKAREVFFDILSRHWSKFVRTDSSR